MLWLRVNGVERSVDPDWQNENLLVALREQLGLTGSRYGCGTGQCGPVFTLTARRQPVAWCRWARQLTKTF